MLKNRGLNYCSGYPSSGPCQMHVSQDALPECGRIKVEGEDTYNALSMLKAYLSVITGQDHYPTLRRVTVTCMWLKPG